jgi:predicted 3-demethylubiquinone-9 3-methyltransferase (glyoxalase superfamily)
MMTSPTHKIVPYLWFDREAREAAAFYCYVFPDGKLTSTTTLRDTPGGDCDVVAFTLAGQPFMAISAGPLFRINPSISFILNFDPSRDAQAREHLDALWTKLAPGGNVLMPLDRYPFSEHYGWIQDRYGVSWQLILSDPVGDQRPFITPSLLFVGDVCGMAEEASDHYLAVFKDAKRGISVRYPAGVGPDREGTIMYTDFMLANQWFAAMDSAQAHDFAFNEAVSFLVNCDTQDEIDHYWDRLSAVPEAEQCGWLKDRYGISWQIVPAVLQRMLQDQDPGRLSRVTQAFLAMKKFDLAALQRAYDG